MFSPNRRHPERKFDRSAPHRYRAVVAAVIILGAVTLTACGSSSKASSPSTTSAGNGTSPSSSTTGASAGTVVIGVVADVTGASDGVGIPQYDAMELAAAQIN